jgi:glyoxylase-like metal-dependent hydrolase (beta-lactamase superfamily II)
MTLRDQPVQHTIETPYPVGPVHSYSLERDGEILLFDSGPDTEQARDYYRNNLELERLRHILITHCHIDHYGLAHWLEKESGATVYLPYRDFLKIKRNKERLEGMYGYLMSVGFDEKFVEELHGTMSSGSIFPKLPENCFVAEERVKDLFGFDVLDCPGHSQSDIVYNTEHWAVTGDTLLKGIFQSPLLDIDLESGERFSNYTAYCESVVKLAALSGKRILPGHREGVISVEDTLLAYIERLLQRVTQLLPFKGEKNIAAIIERIAPPTLTPFQVYLKVSEIQFILDMFKQPDRLRESVAAAGLFDSVKNKYERAIGSQP